ncbi:MAG TPA: hypothetical protein VK177_19910 [Flavobacteriales bacterium]|nr:hypothetical protein [Flavobacteriales bacterium]
MFKGSIIYLWVLCTVVFASCGDSLPKNACDCREKSTALNDEIHELDSKLQTFTIVTRQTYKEKVRELIEKAVYADSVQVHCRKIYKRDNNYCMEKNTSFWDCGEFIVIRSEELRQKYTGNWDKDSVRLTLLNDPENPASLLAYLNREKYGTWPVSYGPYGNNVDSTNNNDTLFVKRFAIRQGQKTIGVFKSQKHARDYIQTAKLQGVTIADTFVTVRDTVQVFPRMWSSKQFRKST